MSKKALLLLTSILSISAAAGDFGKPELSLKCFERTWGSQGAGAEKFIHIYPEEKAMVANGTVLVAEEERHEIFDAAVEMMSPKPENQRGGYGAVFFMTLNGEFAVTVSSRGYDSMVKIVQMSGGDFEYFRNCEAIEL